MQQKQQVSAAKDCTTKLAQTVFSGCYAPVKELGVTNHWTEVDWTGLDWARENVRNKPPETKLSTHKNQTQWNTGFINPCLAISTGVC